MNLSPLGAYANVARLSEPDAIPAAGGGTAAMAKSFGTALAEAAGQAVGTIQASEQATMEGIAGTLDTHQVVAAMTKAELTIQATVAIRDKMVQAYQELMRMPV